jgi:hypothetical protein
MQPESPTNAGVNTAGHSANYAASRSALELGMTALRRAFCGQLKPFDELLGRKLRVRLGRVVIWCHDATNLIAPDDHSSAALSGNGRAPATRFAFVGDYRKLGDISHLNRLGRQAHAC